MKPKTQWGVAEQDKIFWEHESRGHTIEGPNLEFQFEDDIYRNFVVVLNSKKTKLCELQAKTLRIPSLSKKKDKDDEVVE